MSDKRKIVKKPYVAAVDTTEGGMGKILEVAQANGLRGRPRAGKYIVMVCKDDHNNRVALLQAGVLDISGWSE